MKGFVAILAVLALPAAARAQTADSHGAQGAKAAAIDISRIAGGGTAARENIGDSGAKAPLLSSTNRWGAYQVGCWNPIGCVSPKIGVVFNAIGPLEGENDVFDGVSYNGFSQFMAERYDIRDGKWTGVGPNEVVGGFLGAAQEDTGSDPADAGMLLFTTEAQSKGHDGMGAELDYTPNGSTALTRGLSVSPQGRGGVTIGGGYAHNNPYRYESPADLGPGTLHAADSVVTGNHLASDGPRPSLSDCGAGAAIAGTDAAGRVSNGGAVAACTVTFARPYASEVVCIVQDYASPKPTPYLTALGVKGFKVSWSAAFKGDWFYLCQGVS